MVAKTGPDFDHGASMILANVGSGAGPAVAEGHVIVNSWYGLYSHSPGNLLLVYSVDGK
jgi:hypothetical protein